MVEAARKYERVFQTGSHRRSSPPNHFAARWSAADASARSSESWPTTIPARGMCGLPAQPVPARARLGFVVRPRRGCALQHRPVHAAGEPRLDVVPHLLRRRDDRLGRARPGPGAMGPGHGRERADRGLDRRAPSSTRPPTPNPSRATAATTSAASRKCSSATRAALSWSWATVRAAGHLPSARKARSRSTSANTGRTGKPGQRDGQADQTASVRHNHVENWLDCIKSREKPIADVEIGHRSATVCHLGNIARWTGHKLRWDPVKEIFSDDAEANTYLDRQRRKPYELPERV